MKKKLYIIISAAICLALTLTFGIRANAESPETTNYATYQKGSLIGDSGYPDAGSNPYSNVQDIALYNEDSIVTPKSVPCTYVAWQEAWQRCGVSLPGWGNAGNWFNNAQKAGYATGSEPREDSIAVWTGGGSGYGHVAYVTSVDSNSFTVIEGGSWYGRYNYGFANGVKLTNKKAGQKRDGDSSLTLKGFIYLDKIKVDLSDRIYYVSNKPSGVSLDVTASLTNNFVKKVSSIKLELMDNNGAQLGSLTNSEVRNTSTSDCRTFRLADSGVKLQQGASYKYKYSVVINGATYTSATKSFRLKRANKWTHSLKIKKGWHVGSKKAGKPTATAKYGKVTFTYGKSPDKANSKKFPKKSGTYYVKASVPETGKYLALSATKKFTIYSNNKWTEKLTIKGWTAGSKANKPHAAAKYGKVKYEYSHFKIGGYSKKVPSKAGTYYVRATVSGKKNCYKKITATVKFKIAKKKKKSSKSSSSKTISGGSYKHMPNFSDNPDKLLKGVKGVNLKINMEKKSVWLTGSKCKKGGITLRHGMDFFEGWTNGKVVLYIRKTGKSYQLRQCTLTSGKTKNLRTIRKVKKSYDNTNGSGNMVQIETIRSSKVWVLSYTGTYPKAKWTEYTYNLKTGKWKKVRSGKVNYSNVAG